MLPGRSRKMVGCRPRAWFTFSRKFFPSAPELKQQVQSLLPLSSSNQCLHSLWFLATFICLWQQMLSMSQVQKALVDSPHMSLMILFIIRPRSPWGDSEFSSPTGLDTFVRMQAHLSHHRRSTEQSQLLVKSGTESLSPGVMHKSGSVL